MEQDGHQHALPYNFKHTALWYNAATKKLSTLPNERPQQESGLKANDKPSTSAATQMHNSGHSKTACIRVPDYVYIYNATLFSIN